MGSGVSKTEQAKANRQLQAQLKSLQSQVKRLQISSTTILKDDDFALGDPPQLSEIKAPPTPPGMTNPSENGNPATDDDNDVIGDAMAEVDQNSAIAMSTSMMVMEFLPYCKSGDKETDDTILTTLRDTHPQEIAFDARDANGNTMLVLSIMYRYTEAAQVLIQRKADPNILNYNGASPLSYACSEGTMSVDIVKSLLKAKAKPNTAAVGANSCTPLHYAASADGAHEVIEVMLDAGTNTLSVDDEGYTAYDYAEFNMHQRNMDLLGVAMRSNKPLAEGEMWLGEEYTEYFPDTTPPENLWDDDEYEYEEENADDEAMMSSVLGAMDTDNRSKGANEDEDLMTTILAEKKVSDNKHMIGTWRNLAWTAGAKRVTRRIEFEIAVAMKELQHVQEHNKSKQKEGASSAPMGKQKQIIDKLKKNLDATKQKITNTKAKVAKIKREINDMNAKNGAEASMRQAELDMRRQKNDNAKEEVEQLKAQMESLRQSKTAGVAAMRKRLTVQIAGEQKNVEKNEATAKQYEQEAKDLQKELEDTVTGIEKRKVDVANLEETQKQLHVLSKEIEASAEARAQEGRKAVALKMKDHQDAEMIAIMEEKGRKEMEKEKLRKQFETEVHKRHKLKAVLDDMKGHSQIFCVFGPQPPVSDEGEADAGKRLLLARRVNKYCISVKND